MEQREDIGTRRDLVLYRIESAKEALKSAKVLLDAESYKASNNRAYYTKYCKKMGIVQKNSHKARKPMSVR